MPISRAPSHTSACAKTSFTSWRARSPRVIRNRGCFSSRWVGSIRMETEFGIKTSSTPTPITAWAFTRYRHTAVAVADKSRLHIAQRHERVDLCGPEGWDQNSQHADKQEQRGD